MMTRARKPAPKSVATFQPQHSQFASRSSAPKAEERGTPAGESRVSFSLADIDIFPRETVQPKMMHEVQHRQAQAAGQVLQEKEEEAPNMTGMPDQLKSGIENLSGMDLSSVRVHYNSPKPAQLNALAYTQGQEIHVAPAQEKHLPHEGWHVVQQMQGRVKPTTQLNDGVSINADQTLEHEADVMGTKAANGCQHSTSSRLSQGATGRVDARNRRYHSILAAPASVGRTATIQALWEVEGKLFGRNNLQTDPISFLVTRGFLTELEAKALPPNILNGIHQTLDSSTPISIELLVNQVREALHNLLTDPTPAEGMEDEGHVEDEGDAPLQFVNPEDIPASMLDTLKNQLPFMPIIQEVRRSFGDAIALRTLELWYSVGVVTRHGFIELVRAAHLQILGKPAQFKRGAGSSGPASYKGSSNSYNYLDVTYNRDGNGYFDFGSPASYKSWKNPIAGWQCNLQSSCTHKGYGLMPSGGKIALAAGSRSQHFAIANKLNGIGASGSSPPNLTWHHLMPEYHMILVDRQAHRKHGHNGGKFLWK